MDPCQLSPRGRWAAQQSLPVSHRDAALPLLPEEGPCPEAGALSLGPQHGGRGPAGNQGPGLEPAGGGRGPTGRSTSQPPGPPVLGSGATSHPPSRHPVFSGAAPHKEPWDDAGPPGTREGPHLTCFP